MGRAWRLSIALVSLGACSDAFVAERAADYNIAVREEAVVYGSDDRRDVVDVAPGIARSLAELSSVALVPPWALQPTADGKWQFIPHTLSRAWPTLCADEAFLQQPTAALCGGVLVAPDLVLTAGHCFPDPAAACETYRYVLGYRISMGGQVDPVDDDDVYTCRKLVATELSDVADPVQWDFALVQLDRPVTAPRGPVTVRASPVQRGESVTVIGYPLGLPAKVDAGGAVQRVRPQIGDYWLGTTDTFGASSGSPAFDREGSLIGVLLGGGEDFAWDDEAQCTTLRHVDPTVKGAHFEALAYPHRAMGSLCQSAWANENPAYARSLCGNKAQNCGWQTEHGLEPCAPDVRGTTCSVGRLPYGAGLLGRLGLGVTALVLLTRRRRGCAHGHHLVEQAHPQRLCCGHGLGREQQASRRAAADTGEQPCKPTPTGRDTHGGVLERKRRVGFAHPQVAGKG